MNPTVPVIGPKVTVVGSKVTEMLKRKLQQRLLAEKAKKVRTSSSEDEREPCLPAGNGTVTSSGSSSEHLMFVQQCVTSAPCPGSVDNMNSVIIHNSFIMQNSQNQNALRTSLDANKNKVSKPKSSKPKKCPKAPAPKCVIVGVDASVSAGGIIHGSTCSDGSSNRNVAICSMNNTFSPELRQKYTSITLNNTIAQPLHLTTQSNVASFTNGFYPFHTGLHKSNLLVSCEDKKLGFPSGMFISGCTGNKVSNACSSTTDGTGDLLGSVLGNTCTGDYDNCHLPAESGDDAMEIPLATAAKTGIPKDSGDGDDVHKFPDGQGIGSKKSSDIDPVNPSLIDSSLWPLIYGENSKQLDDYIHRIYCRDCQKSQEQRPLGDRGDSDRQTSKNSIRVHSEVNKCQLQHLKDVNEANICSSFNHTCNGENTEMVLPPEEVGDVLTSGKMTPSVQFQDRMSLFQEQNTLQLAPSEDGMNLDSSQSMVSDASRKTDRDNEASSSKSSASSANFLNSTSINLGDTRSTKSKKSSSKAVPKASTKVIKFHEYKGPPNVSRPTCTITMPPAVRSPPLKDDLFQKLQQRQLCLQMQLQLEFRNRGLLASLGSNRLSNSCDVSKIGQQIQMNGPRSALGVAEKMGMEPVGQPAIAQVTFSTPAAAATAAMGNGKTPILLQSIPSAMTSPSKFVLPVGGGVSHPLQPSGITAVQSATSAGGQGITTSSSSSSPSSLLMSSSSSAASSPSSSSVGGVFSATIASSTWPGCQSVQHWNNVLTQSDKTVTSDTSSMKPVSESTTASGWQHHLMAASSAASGGPGVFSVCQAVTSQSAAALVASAMTSAPILYASGKVLPNQAASSVPNASKSKISVGCSPCNGNRAATVVIPTRLEDVKVADLKAECRKRKLVVSGPKPNLIERLRPYEDDILHCLAVNLRATLQDPESQKDDKNASSTNMADQTSSPSSLTSMDSVVNIQPLCHLNDDDSSAGELCVSAEKPDAAAVRPSVTSGTDQLASEKIKQSLVASTLRNHITSQTPLSLSLSPNVTAAGSSRPGHFNIPPIQFIANSMSGVNIPSSLGSLNFTTSPNMELAHEASMTSADQSAATFASASRPSMSFSLPSVSQWYRMPPPLAVASIPVSNPSLPGAPALRLFPPTCFVATPSSSTVSVCQTPLMNAAYRCHNPLSSPFAIPPSSACLTNPCPGHALVIQSTSSPRLSIQSIKVSAAGTGRSPDGDQPQSGAPDTIQEDFSNQQDNHLMMSSPTDNRPAPWSAIYHSKLDASGGLDLVSRHQIQPSEILSSSDLLSWQQQQIMELQKQLHLSRLQLLETHRRVWEQREQFQVNISAPAQSSTLAAYTRVPSFASSRNMLPVEKNPTLVEQMGFQCDALQDIPKLGESVSCDVTQELFDDFTMGMNPLTSGIKELEADISCQSSPGLEDFGDSTCAEMLSKEIGDQESIDISQLAKTFLSPGIETGAHSMLDICSLGPSDVSANKTSSKENISDLLSPAEQREEQENGSFYLSVPLKEPPKYDDVVKGKQNSSSVSASSVAMASSSVDDLLQMLMRQTDMLVNSANMSDHVLSSGSDILTNTSPLTFTSPMSHSTPVDDLTTQELDAYPYSAGSNSSSGISTAPSTCGDLLSDPLSSSGMSTSMFSEVPFQLPDWTDSEFLELSMLGRMKLDQTEGVSINKTQHGTPDIPMVLPPLSSPATSNMMSKAAPPSNDYDPCLAGFGPSYAADGLGLTDLLDVSVPSLPPSDMANVSRSYDVLEDLFIMEEDDLFHIRDPAYLIAERRLGVSSISRT